MPSVVPARAASPTGASKAGSQARGAETPFVSAQRRAGALKLAGLAANGRLEGPTWLSLGDLERGLNDRAHPLNVAELFRSELTYGQGTELLTAAGATVGVSPESEYTYRGRYNLNAHSSFAPRPSDQAKVDNVIALIGGNVDAVSAQTRITAETKPDQRIGPKLLWFVGNKTSAEIAALYTADIWPRFKPVDELLATMLKDPDATLQGLMRKSSFWPREVDASKGEVLDSLGAAAWRVVDLFTDERKFSGGSLFDALVGNSALDLRRTEIAQLRAAYDTVVSDPSGLRLAEHLRGRATADQIEVITDSIDDISLKTLPGSLQRTVFLLQGSGGPVFVDHVIDASEGLASHRSAGPQKAAEETAGETSTFDSAQPATPATRPSPERLQRVLAQAQNRLAERSAQANPIDFTE